MSPANVAPAGVFHTRGGEVSRIAAWWEEERALADLQLAPPADRT